MAPDSPESEFAGRAAGSERAFVLALGGFAYDVAGASFVTHERIPVPRFNFVVVGNVGADRQTSFFESALDHYFQRALRPTFRVPAPAASHVDAGLRRFGFRARSAPHSLLWTRAGGRPTRASGPMVRLATRDDLDAITALWMAERERPEFRRSLDVLWSHPNEGERVIPLLAEVDGVPVGGGVVYVYDGVAGLHGVATIPGSRGRGVASALVTRALGLSELETLGAVVLAVDSPAAERPLGALGFSALRRFVEYELPLGTELTLPDPGPPQPPRWRPPRNPGAAADPLAPGKTRRPAPRQ
jgi:GNAT superfamily N-acetyltransferase